MFCVFCACVNITLTVTATEFELPETMKITSEFDFKDGEVFVLDGVPRIIVSEQAYGEIDTVKIDKCASNKIHQDILNICDDFHNKCKIKEHLDYNFVSDFFSKIKNVQYTHNIEYKEIATNVMSAGMICAANDLHTNCENDFSKWFAAGKELYKTILSEPIETLRLEIYKNKIVEMLNPKTNATVIKHLRDERNYSFDKVLVPMVALEKIHQAKRQELSYDGTRSAILNKNKQNNQYEWVEETKYEGSDKELIRIIEDQAARLLKTNTYAGKLNKGSANPFGYINENQKIAAVPNLIDFEIKRDLKEEEKNWVMVAAAVRYMLENPESSVEDAVESGCKIAIGLFSYKINDDVYSNPFISEAKGDTTDICKADAIIYLNMIHARELCHVGRFKDHLDYIADIDAKNNIVTETKAAYRASYEKIPDDIKLPDINNYKDDITPLAEYEVPFKREVLRRINVGAGDGVYGNCCGIFATQFNSRQDLIKWVYANYKKDDPIFAPNKFVHLKTSEQLVSFVGTYFESIAYNTAQFYKNVTPISEDYKSYAWIIDLLQRPGYLFEQVNVSGKYQIDVANGWMFKMTNAIFPFLKKGKVRSRRPIYWWLNPGHYNALIERDDYIGLAKLIRHNNN